MNKRVDKILIGIEAIIYIVVIIGILINIWDYKYVKIDDWNCIDSIHNNYYVLWGNISLWRSNLF